MSIDEQPTQRLAFPVAPKQPMNYEWLKALADASGVHFMQVHRFVLGKRIPEVIADRIRQTLQTLIPVRQRDEA